MPEKIGQTDEFYDDYLTHLKRKVKWYEKYKNSIEFH